MLTRPQIVPASYQNEARRIHIPNLPPHIIPSSPEDLKLPVVMSGIVTPSSGIGSPAEPIKTNLHNNTLRRIHEGAVKIVTPEEAKDSLHDTILKSFDKKTLERLEDDKITR